MPLRVFISHSSKDKILAGDLKKCLERFGLDVFVAHKDIKPSEEWQNEILRQLDRAHIFMALLTKNFKKSLWTDQEFGIASKTRARILPLYVDKMPYGFMSKHQAHRLSTNNLEDSCSEIALKAIDTNRAHKQTFRKWLIYALIHSEDFKTSIEISKLINKLKGLKGKQASEIICGACENDQVYGSYAQGDIRIFYKKYKGVLSEKAHKLYVGTFGRKR